MIPCSGFIIMSKNKKNTIIVSTHHNNLGFPKGKRHKDEPIINTALRELEEETGLTADKIDIIDNLYFDEMSIRGNPATRYFIGIIKNDNDNTFMFDNDELNDVKWMSCDDLFKSDRFRENRKIILNQVLNKLNTSD